MKKKPAKKVKAKAAKKPKAKKIVKAKAKIKVKVKAKAKKSSSKRPKKKAAVAPPKQGVIPPLNSVLLGFVEDYFAKVGVIALTLKAPLDVGQRIQVLGHTTHIEQPVESMQIEHAPVNHAGPNDGIGIKVKDRARRGDHVYLLK